MVITVTIVFLGLESSVNASFPLESCESIDKVDEECDNISSSGCRDLLEKCQKYLENKSSQIEEDIK